MELTHEMAGLIICLAGALCIALSGPIPRQVHRWHVYALENVEPAVIQWPVRVLGLTLFVLGLVTMANPA